MYIYIYVYIEQSVCVNTYIYSIYNFDLFFNVCVCFQYLQYSGDRRCLCFSSTSKIRDDPKIASGDADHFHFIENCSVIGQESCSCIVPWIESQAWHVVPMSSRHVVLHVKTQGTP